MLEKGNESSGDKRKRMYVVRKVGKGPRKGRGRRRGKGTEYEVEGGEKLTRDT